MLTHQGSQGLQRSDRRPRLMIWAAVSAGIATLPVSAWADYSAEAAPAGATAGAPIAISSGPQPYQEYLSYGAHVRTSYVPGFVPKTSSLFENPREFPSAVGKLADPYLYAGRAGWFYLSPNGYQSSVPPGSQAHDYMTGRLGITSSMQYGYPRGQRVVEEVIIPYAASGEKGGLYISAGAPTGVALGPEVLQRQTTVQVDKSMSVGPGGPQAVAVPVAAPRAPAAIPDEVSDK